MFMNRFLYKNILFLSLAICTSFGELLAQDIHFTQINASPMHLNPALTGVIDGRYRVTGVYRDQWGSVFAAPNAYKTFGVSGEGKLLALKRDFVGIGGSVVTDRAGDTGYGQLEASVGASYQKMLGRGRNKWSKSSQYLIAGLSAGFGQRGLNWSKSTFSTQYDGTQYNPNANTGEPSNILDSRLYLNANAGLLYYNMISYRRNFYVGGSIHHLNSPNISLWSGRNERLGMRWNIHGGGEFLLKERAPISIMPSLAVTGQGKNFNTLLGLMMRYSAKSWEDEVALRWGLVTRFMGDVEAPSGRVDAIAPAVLVEFKGFNLGISYDLTISTLKNANGGRGAFEIMLQYVEPDNRRRKTGCPKF